MVVAVDDAPTELAFYLLFASGTCVLLGRNLNYTQGVSPLCSVFHFIFASGSSFAFPVRLVHFCVGYLNFTTRSFSSSPHTLGR
jgi:hypothetical protein